VLSHRELKVLLKQSGVRDKIGIGSGEQRNGVAFSLPLMLVGRAPCQAWP